MKNDESDDDARYHIEVPDFAHEVSEAIQKMADDFESDRMSNQEK